MMKRMYLFVAVAMVPGLIALPVDQVSATETVVPAEQAPVTDTVVLPEQVTLASTPCTVQGERPFIRDGTTANGQSWISCWAQNINAGMIQSQVQHKDNHFFARWHNLGVPNWDWGNVPFLRVTASGSCDGQGEGDWYRTRAFGRDQFDRTKVDYSPEAQLSC